MYLFIAAQFKHLLSVCFILTMDHDNPQIIITQLCSSPQLNILSTLRLDSKAHNFSILVQSYVSRYQRL